MPKQPAAPPDPKLTREVLQTRFKSTGEEVLRLVCLAEELDWLGDAAQHPPHSDQQKLANTLSRRISLQRRRRHFLRLLSGARSRRP